MPDELKTEGGYQMELGRAATRMADAIRTGDADELARAMSDHAAALGSQATSSMAAIARSVIEQLQALTIQIEQRNRRDLDWRVDHREHLDSRFDNFGRELDDLIARQDSTFAAVQEATADVKKLTQTSDELRIGQARLSGQVTSLGENQDELSHRVDKVEHRLEKVEHGITGLDKRVGTLEGAIKKIAPQVERMDVSVRLMRQVMEASPQPEAIKKLLDDAK